MSKGKKVRHAPIGFKANKGGTPTPPPGIVVHNTAELLAALATVTSGQTISCAAGSYADIGHITGLVFSPAITITSADLSHHAVLNYFEAENCIGITFADIDFEVILPNFYGWKFDTCSRLTFTRIVCRSNSTTPIDYDNCAGIRFSTCDHFIVQDSLFHDLNAGIQTGFNCDTWTIARNEFRNMNSDGVDVGLSTNGLIDANYFHDTFTTGTNHPDAVQFTQDTLNITISNNLVWRGAGNYTQGFFLGDGNHTNPRLDSNLVVGTGFSGLRPISCHNVIVNNNELVSYVGDNWTNLFVQLSDIVTVTNNITVNVAGSLSIVTSTNVTQSGNTTAPAVTDQGAAAIAAWRALHPTVPT